MAEEKQKERGGRNPPNIKEVITWTQRIEKEEAVNGKVNPQGFSVRAVVRIEDVPVKHKPGHIHPLKEASNPNGFDPEAAGWDPKGKESLDFRRSIDLQTAGPGSRHPYPETCMQEMGWFLAPLGDPAERMRRKKLRLGLGWPEGPPGNFSECSASLPTMQPAVSELSAATVESSMVSMVAPTELSRVEGSQLSRSAPVKPAASQLSRSAPVKPAASQLSRTAPSQLSAASGAASKLSRASSLPAVAGADAATRLRHREAKLMKVMKRNMEYGNVGPIGARWAKPLGATDATQFQNDFSAANGGVPIYKFYGKEASTLRDKMGIICPDWK